MNVETWTKYAALTDSGFSYPQNIELAARLESTIRSHGGIPATIGVLDGVPRIGMQPAEIDQLVSAASRGEAIKLSRRDLGHVGGLV